jgi:hypothetical protein
VVSPAPDEVDPVRPPEDEDEDKDVEHPTGEDQAETNKELDPPA